MDTIEVKPWTGSEVIEVPGGIALRPSNQPPTVLQIKAPGGAPLVKVFPDGRVEFGPDYSPDEAARIFWDAIGQRAPRSA